MQVETLSKRDVKRSKGSTMKLERHQRRGMIAALVLSLMALAALCSTGSTTTVTPLCRHIVLAQHAAAVDAGFEAETYRIKNPKPHKPEG